MDTLWPIRLALADQREWAWPCTIREIAGTSFVHDRDVTDLRDGPTGVNGRRRHRLCAGVAAKVLASLGRVGAHVRRFRRCYVVFSRYNRSNSRIESGLQTCGKFVN